jgi:hypothetical protein
VSAVVFLGPSLDLASARQVLDADYRPPVARGDIDRLLDGPERPAAIGLVDGRFLHSFSISPKEVLRAVDAGVAVYGASSMGALRAAECAPYGMVGVGAIYAEYASGRLDADDEVALVFDPESGRALSEPLVNWRLALAAGVASGRIEAEPAERFLAEAKRLYFPHRTLATVLAGLSGVEGAADLVGYLAREAPDAKRDDALALLRRIRADLLTRLTGPRTPA